MDNQFVWVNFYKEFASKLLAYKNNRGELVEKVKAIYAETGINMPTLEKDNQLVDIDPFTVFGLFNKSSMREANRIKIITAVRKIFDVVTAVPDSFDSVPVLNNQNATFYYFIDSRSDEDIDDLWNLFDSALKYAADPSADNRDVLSKYFDLVINKKGNGNSKITMGLYWISPNSFLNLDSRNEWYIYESGKIPADIVAGLPEIETKIAASKYFAIVEKLREYLQSGKCNLHDFKELSFEAWNYSTQVNEEKKAEKKQTQREQKGAKEYSGVRPHKEKINISKEIINKTRGAVAPYAAQIFTHLSVVSSRQRSYDWLRCEEVPMIRSERNAFPRTKEINA